MPKTYAMTFLMSAESAEVNRGTVTVVRLAPKWWEEIPRSRGKYRPLERTFQQGKEKITHDRAWINLDQRDQVVFGLLPASTDDFRGPRNLRIHVRMDDDAPTGQRAHSPFADSGPLKLDPTLRPFEFRSRRDREETARDEGWFTDPMEAIHAGLFRFEIRGRIGYKGKRYPVYFDPEMIVGDG